MKRLFDEMPIIHTNRLELREFTAKDASALRQIASDKRIYQYLPTFLYEQKYDDANTVIEKMRSEMFDTKDSILLAVTLKEDPSEVIGIAEIYNYESEKEKASIGYRLLPDYWGRGFASEITAALTEYLLKETDVRKITAHVMEENPASAKVLLKNGYEKKWTGLREDWGFDTPVLINKFRYKMSREEKEKILQEQDQNTM